jgi:hypothetical protein
MIGAGVGVGGTGVAVAVGRGVEVGVGVLVRRGKLVGRGVNVAVGVHSGRATRVATAVGVGFVTVVSGGVRIIETTTHPIPPMTRISSIAKTIKMVFCKRLKDFISYSSISEFLDTHAYVMLQYTNDTLRLSWWQVLEFILLGIFSLPSVWQGLGEFPADGKFARSSQKNCSVQYKALGSTSTTFCRSFRYKEL